MYYAEKLDNTLNISRDIWTIKFTINKCDNSTVSPCFRNSNNSETTNKEYICEMFNEYFTNIGTNLASKLPSTNTNPISYMSPQKKAGSFFMSPTSPNEIVEIRAQLKNKNNSGFDNITRRVVKQSVYAIAINLSTIIKSSFEQGIFPDLLKIAKITDYKNEPKDYICNYRPISILPFFSKSFEKAMYNRLNSYISKLDFKS